MGDRFVSGNINNNSISRTNSKNNKESIIIATVIAIVIATAIVLIVKAITLLMVQKMIKNLSFT